jgi:ApaG protein
MGKTPYEAETDGIVVRVTPSFLEDESRPEEHRFIWAYHIEIENKGERTVQLQTRHWRITDRDGRVQEVNGVGVVGKTPVLRPGDTFEYSSGAPLSVPSGMMQGAYRLTDEQGELIEVRIPLFALDSPYDRRKAN